VRAVVDQERDALQVRRILPEDTPEGELSAELSQRGDVFTSGVWRDAGALNEGERPGVDPQGVCTYARGGAREG
jgi:hypothetical protein